MAFSSPTSVYPTTPASQRLPLHYKPLNSSPLAATSPPWSPKMSSPVAAAQARRRSQYKTPVGHTSESSASRRLFTNEVAPEQTADPQKAFLRHRFRARCFERAAKAREQAISGKRKASHHEPSSDDYAMDDDEEEDEEDVMQDELFRRIMANANHKQKHAYRVSYAQEVGSSYDPDIEDASRWEEELKASPKHKSTSVPPFYPSTSTAQVEDYPFPEYDDDSNFPIPDEVLLDLEPVDLEDEELEAYAEECARRAALADFEDIPWDELDGRLSEDEDLNPSQNVVQDEMDMT